MTLVERLHKRAEIRRQIATRKSVQEGKPDKIADLLEEAATELDPNSEGTFAFHMMNENASLKNENARLREALARISSMVMCSHFYNFAKTCPTCISRVALNGDVMP